LRRLDEFEAKPLDGTDGAVSPFFSPDGQWIAYDDHHNRKLKKVVIGGGVPVTLAEAPDFRGGTWTEDGQIIFAPDYADGLYRIPASGGTAERLTTPDPNEGEQGHLWPQILPGDRAVIFSTSGRSPRLKALHLSNGRQSVVRGVSGLARYCPAGSLLYARAWSLYSVRFDAERFTVEGPHEMVASEVWQSGMGTSQFAVADNGVVADSSGKWDTHKLQPVWVTREGREQALPLPPRNYHELGVSRDGTRVVLTSYVRNHPDMWVYDAVHGTTTDITGEQAGRNPLWVGGDRDALFYQTPQGLFYRTAGVEEPIGRGRMPQLRKMTDSSPDGRHLLVQWSDPNDLAGWDDLWTIESAEGGSVLFERADHKQTRAVWSPCGRWIAYESDESGRREIFVKPYPGPGFRVAVTPDGGREPLWSPDGKELYYRNRGKIMAARLQTEPEFRVVETEELFDDRYYSCILCRAWDIAPDGRFLMLYDPQHAAQEQIRVMLDWRAH